MTFDPSTPYSPNPTPSPPAQDRPTRRGGFLGFLTTVPGILTAAAGLITAVTGGVGLYLSQNDDAGGDEIYNITVQGEPVPAGGGEVDMSNLGTGLPDASVDDEVTAAANGCLNGDPGACDTLLYLLAEGCYAGDGIRCDDLYLISAVGSSYEDYGATCGGRFYDWTYAGACSELQ